MVMSQEVRLKGFRLKCLNFDLQAEPLQPLYLSSYGNP
jgi:hypothetical protein